MSTYLAPPQSLPFELGEPAAFGGLALVPLFSTVKPRLEYIGLDEAVARGLAVTEVDEVGSVASLFVSNPLDVNVLLYEGEEFVGAKQNRILDRTLLVQGKSKTLVPVSCVERGRWAYRSSTFATAPRAAYPELRLAKREGGGQAQVWASAAAKSARLDAWSPTDASEEMYLKHGASLEEYVARLPRRDGQCGAIVCLGGRVTCLDFVGRSDVYAGLYAKLLRGYALDAIERPSTRRCRRSTSRACSAGSAARAVPRPPSSCLRALSRLGGGEGGSSRSDLLKRNPGLLAQRGKVEVDPLAGHQPLFEWHDVGEGHGECSPAWRNPEPVATAGSAQGPPHDDDVVAESHTLVFRSQIRE
jgi:hypothetical protein